MSFGVPNAEGVPRLTDVALFLCCKGMTSVWPLIVAADPQAVEDFAAWCLHRVAFTHECVSAGASGETISDAAAGRDVGEANFSLAFNALCRGPGESVSCRPRESGRSSQPATPATASRNAASGAGAGGLEYFEELLDLCRSVGGRDIRGEFLRRVIAVITGDTSQRSDAPLRPPWARRSVDERAAVVLPALSAMFTKLSEPSAVHAAGSITRSFAVWMTVSWNCASFSWQTHVARVVGEWLAEFETRLTCNNEHTLPSGATLPHLSHPKQQQQQHPKPPRPKSSVFGAASSRTLYPATEGKDKRNIVSMYMAMRRICEDCLPNNKSLMELLLQSGFGIQFHDQNMLEYMISDAVVASGAAGGGAAAATSVTTPAAVSDAQQSHHSILLRITSGVLLYAQFYLSVHSLEAALHSAQTAVLIGHQWRSDQFLTMAHYSSFLVHVACQDTPAAAGDIAIMLQLADAASHRENDADMDTNINTPRFYAGCLGYMGAALLLLICPGTVDTYLRSLIITGVVAGRPAASGKGTNDASNTLLDGNSKNNGILHTTDGGEATSGGQSVVVQTIAQTVRFALWLSEMETFLDPSSTNMTEMIIGVARETLMIIAGHYGVRSCMKAINTVSLSFLLDQLDEEVPSTMPSLFSYQPSLLLLHETLRQTAHRALSTQVGAIDASSGAGPFNILHDFILAVEVNYGEDGCEVVKENFFFMSTYRFIFAMWLRKHGYIKSAYQELTRLCESMLFNSRSNMDGTLLSGETLSQSTSASATEWGKIKDDVYASAASTTRTTTKARDDAGGTNKKALHYWPPDHLLLWQHVQFERAQLARYLGYSSTLPEIDGALRRVSATSRFVMGVLYADLISALMCFQRGNHRRALQVLDTVLSSAKRIGLTLIQAHARSMRVFVLLSCGQWSDALETLAEMHPLPTLLEPSFLLAQLHARSEVMVACPTATEDDLAAAVEHHVRWMEACGCFLEESEEEDSTGPTLAEKLCVHACIARLTVTTSAEQRQALDNNLTEVAKKLKHRQLQEGKWQVVCNMPLRRVCRDVLSGALLQKMMQTP